MKLKHNVPVRLLRVTDEVSPEYQAEVDLTMARAEAAWHRAQRRLAKAETRLQHAVQARSATKVSIRELELLVEHRRLELEQLHRLMAASAFPARNRGRKSFRPVPMPRGVL